VPCGFSYILRYSEQDLFERRPWQPYLTLDAFDLQSGHQKSVTKLARPVQARFPSCRLTGRVIAPLRVVELSLLICQRVP